MRNRAFRKLFNDKPIVFFGSPMCTECSTLNKLNHSNMSPEEVEQRMAYARKHLEFCIKMYEIQWRSGRYFLHEHPESAFVRNSVSPYPSVPMVKDHQMWWIICCLWVSFVPFAKIHIIHGNFGGPLVTAVNVWDENVVFSASWVPPPYRSCCSAMFATGSEGCL